MLLGPVAGKWSSSTKFGCFTKLFDWTLTKCTKTIIIIFYRLVFIKFCSKVSISRTFCGMLNTCLGGTVFLGVTDDGRADGFTMSR